MTWFLLTPVFIKFRMNRFEHRIMKSLFLTSFKKTNPVYLIHRPEIIKHML